MCREKRKGKAGAFFLEEHKRGRKDGLRISKFRQVWDERWKDKKSNGHKEKNI